MEIARDSEGISQMTLRKILGEIPDIHPGVESLLDQEVKRKVIEVGDTRYYRIEFPETFLLGDQVTDLHTAARRSFSTIKIHWNSRYNFIPQGRMGMINDLRLPELAKEEQRHSDNRRGEGEYSRLLRIHEEGLAENWTVYMAHRQKIGAAVELFSEEELRANLRLVTERLRQGLYLPNYSEDLEIHVSPLQILPKTLSLFRDRVPHFVPLQHFTKEVDRTGFNRREIKIDDSHVTIARRKGKFMPVGEPTIDLSRSLRYAIQPLMVWSEKIGQEGIFTYELGELPQQVLDGVDERADTLIGLLTALGLDPAMRDKLPYEMPLHYRDNETGEVKISKMMKILEAQIALVAILWAGTIARSDLFSKLAA